MKRERKEREKIKEKMKEKEKMKVKKKKRGNNGIVKKIIITRESNGFVLENTITRNFGIKRAISSLLINEGVNV